MRNANCKYKEAELAWEESQVFLGILSDAKQKVCKSTLFSEYCALLFAQSVYDKVIGGFLILFDLVFQETGKLGQCHWTVLFQ